MKHLIHLLKSLRYIAPAVGILKFVHFKVSKKGRMIKAKIDGNTVLVRARTADLNTAVNNLRYEYNFLEDLKLTGLLGQIVDAGAYIGTSALALREKFPDLPIACIEPSPENLAVFRSNTSKIENLSLFEGVLGAQSGLMPLFARDTGEIGNSTVPNRPDSKIDETAQFFVDSFTLQDLIEKNGPIAILKMDIEGGEKSIFDSSSRLLETIPIIICELHERIAPGVTESVSRFLTKHHSIQQHGEKVVILNNRLLFASNKSEDD